MIPMINSFAKLFYENILVVVPNISNQLFPKSILLNSLVLKLNLLNGLALVALHLLYFRNRRIVYRKAFLFDWVSRKNVVII